MINFKEYIYETILLIIILFQLFSYFYFRVFYKKNLVLKQKIIHLLIVFMTIEIIVFLYSIDLLINIKISDLIFRFIAVVLFLVTVKMFEIIGDKKQLLGFFLLLEFLIFLYYIIFIREISVNFYEALGLSLTVYCSYIFLSKIIEPIVPDFRLKTGLSKLSENIFYLITINPVLNKIYFLRNYSLLTVFNLRVNNMVGLSVFAFFVIILFPMLLRYGQFFLIFNITFALGILLFLNEILLKKYHTNVAFRKNFDSNLLYFSKKYFLITKQNDPIKLKLIKRNMAKIAIEGYGYIEFGPMPYKTMKLVAVAGVGVSMMASGLFIYDRHVQLEIVKSNNALELAKSNNTVLVSKDNLQASNNSLEVSRNSLETKKLEVKSLELKAEEVRRGNNWWNNFRKK